MAVDGPIQHVIKHPCPRCESPQSFLRRARYEGEGDKTIVEVFIACKMCGWEAIICRENKVTYELKADIDRLRSLGRRGVPVNRVLASRQARLREAVLSKTPPGDLDAKPPC